MCFQSSEVRHNQHNEKAGLKRDTLYIHREENQLACTEINLQSKLSQNNTRTQTWRQMQPSAPQ